jgi:hypothetical protein
METAALKGSYKAELLTLIFFLLFSKDQNINLT